MRFTSVKVMSVNNRPWCPRFLDPFTNMISKAEKTDYKIFYGSKILSVSYLRNNTLNKNLFYFFSNFADLDDYSCRLFI